MHGEPFEAWAKQSWPKDGVEIALRQGDYYLNFNPEMTRVEEAAVPPNPSVIPLDAARALYEALGELFGYTTISSDLIRRDLLHERKRVDKMIDHLLKD